MTIDMKSFSGEVEAPAAVEQPRVDNVPAQQKVQEEFPMPEIPVASNPEPKAPEEAPKEHPQATHFRALEEKLDLLRAEREEERRNHQLQMEMMRANMVQKTEAPKPKKMFEGMEDSEIPNVGELRKAWDQREAEYANRIDELQVMAQHNDYAEVLEKYAAPLVKDKPHLLKGIMSSENKAMALYELGKIAQQAKTVNPTPTPAPSRSSVAERIVQNASKPGTLAQAGGQPSALSKVDYIANMSDKEFMKFATKHLEQI